MQTLELLSPAKNLECGIAAIDHGADAVYIGAQRFGARAAAGNSVDDIRQLCEYAHQFGAKVYVTVNTIIFDNELDDTRSLIRELADIRVDAILVQDMALMREKGKVRSSSARLLPEGRKNSEKSAAALHFHASTQADNRTPEKVRWLASLGFSRVVLARELSVDEIAAIHREVPEVELEVFVHGALCVSYSGLCYASQHCFGRSANRGECAQLCRMKYDLVDADGRVIEHDRYLLSLKDLCQIDNLERLAEAGATSFKIEGRLKDVAYVKNVTAAYSERLNEIIARHPDRYQRASWGRCTYTFRPDLRKTFNRGYTTYFADGRQPDIFSPDTPKAMGEAVGRVKEIRRDSFNVAGTATFANGDGLCFLNEQRELVGFRVNRAEGNRLFPQRMPQGLRPGIMLYRNNDQAFERLLSQPSAERKIPVTMSLHPTPSGFALTVAVSPAATVQGGSAALAAQSYATATIVCEHQQAEKPQRENIVRQLTKLGGTPYQCDDVVLPDDFNYFIPSSLLADLRRQAVAALSSLNGTSGNHEYSEIHGKHGDSETSETSGTSENPGISGNTPPPYPLPYLYNVANETASAFYEQQGINVAPAFEVSEPKGEKLLMQCRHCLRYALGHCTRKGGTPPTWHEPLALRLGDGRQFPLVFDCKNCQMNVIYF